jgi:hypothetical protein
VAAARAAKQHFASAGYLEAFGYRFSGLNTFGSSHIGSLSLVGLRVYEIRSARFRQGLWFDHSIREGFSSLRLCNLRARWRRNYGLVFNVRVIIVQIRRQTLGIFVGEEFSADSGASCDRRGPADGVGFHMTPGS